MTNGDVSLRDIAAQEFKKLRKTVEALPETPSDADLHQVRIKAKRARYAAELAAPMVGRPAERFVDKAPAQVVATLLDEDVYHCSTRTMYRLLDANREIRERRTARPN